MYSLFIAYANDEWCRFVVHIAFGSPPLISFYCVCFASFFFLFSQFFCEQMAWLNQLNQVQFGKNFSYILSPLASQNYLLQSISVKLIYQFLYLIYCFLFFRCREKSFEEERNKNKDGTSRGVTTGQLPQTGIGMMTFLALISYLLARITLTLMPSFGMPVVFESSIFRNLTYVFI